MCVPHVCRYRVIDSRRAIWYFSHPNNLLFLHSFTIRVDPCPYCMTSLQRRTRRQAQR
ncbi:MAG: BC10 family protein [Ignavibacteriae bacterium]|nr:BC10 family protein [Ignavibacteriota bacterium]